MSGAVVLVLALSFSVAFFVFAEPIVRLQRKLESGIPLTASSFLSERAHVVFAKAVAGLLLAVTLAMLILLTVRALW